jgi:hypothetical protein
MHLHWPLCHRLQVSRPESKSSTSNVIVARRTNERTNRRISRATRDRRCRRANVVAHAGRHDVTVEYRCAGLFLQVNEPSCVAREMKSNECSYGSAWRRRSIQCQLKSSEKLLIVFSSHHFMIALQRLTRRRDNETREKNIGPCVSRLVA